jgi:SH3-like domain-containing protein
MQHTNRVRTIVLLALGTGAAWAADVTVRVTGDRVNLRARPEADAEVVGQVDTGSRLTARSLQGDWVEVAAPDTVDGWVHREFVEEGTVRAARLNVRGGPGVNYREIGFLIRGDPVSVRATFGDWLKIAPPANASLWVHREFIQASALPKPAPTPARSPDPAPNLPRPLPLPPGPAAARSALPAPPQDLALTDAADQGRTVQREGVIHTTRGWFSRPPSRFQLVHEADTPPAPICYLRGDNAQLASFQGRRLRIHGREYQVAGSRLPVVVVDAIGLLEPAP